MKIFTGNSIKACLTVSVCLIITFSCEFLPGENVKQLPFPILPKTAAFVCEGSYFAKTYPDITDPAILGNAFCIGDARKSFYSVGYERIYRYDLRNYELIEAKPFIDELGNSYYAPRDDQMGWLLTSSYANLELTCAVSLLDTLGRIVFSIELESNPSGYVIASTYDNGFVIAGNPSSDLNNVYSFARYSNTGQLQWKKQLINRGQLSKITSLKDGGFLIGGWGDLAQTPTSTKNSFLAKLDDDGNQLWAKTTHVGDLNNKYSIEDIIEAADGDYFLLLHNSERYLALVRADSAYTIKWTSIIENNFTIWPPKMIQFDNDVLIYFSSGPGQFDSDISFASIGANGDLKWKRSYGSAGAEIVHSLIQPDSSGYLLVGWTQNSDGKGGIQTLGYFIKTDLEGFSCY